MHAAPPQARPRIAAARAPRPALAYAALGLILLVGGILRCYRLGALCLWHDEYFSVLFATNRFGDFHAIPQNRLLIHPPDLLGPGGDGPWWAIWNHLDHDTHPPLYYLLLRGWRWVFGTTDAAMRSLSAAASLGAIALLFLIMRQINGTAPALWACAIMAVSGFQLFHAREARNYALLQFIALAALAALMAVIQRGPTARRLIALGAVLLAMLLTHYYALAPLVALMILSAMHPRGAALRRIAAVFGVTLFIYAIIWGPFMLHQRAAVARTTGWTMDDAPGHAARVMWFAARTPFELIGDAPPDSRAPAAAGALLLILPALLWRRRPDLRVWAVWLWCAVGLVALVDLAAGQLQLAIPRYAIVAAPAVYALLASLLAPLPAAASSQAAQRRRWYAHLLPAAALLTAALTHGDINQQPKPDSRALAQAIDAHRQRGDIFIIATCSLPPHEEADNFIRLLHYLRPLPARAMLQSGTMAPAALAPLEAGRSIWVISGPDLTPPRDLVPSARIEAQYFVPGPGFAWRVCVSGAVNRR